LKQEVKIMPMETEKRTQVEFWTQQMAVDPAEAALELRMEITSATVLAALFFVFGVCTLLGIFKVPDEHRVFWTWAEIITSALLFGIMAWAISLVAKKRVNLREMEARIAKESG
jgi:cytosine/uracil/thiamine/allantoin permease